jgi:hypothetical protein
MADVVPFGSGDYLCWLLLLVFARGADLLSTWVATPNLILEGNPLVKKLGLKWSIAFNVVVCALAAFLPLGAIIGTTASLLVAARNFQAAWAVRTRGEEDYRIWREQRLSETPACLFLGCVFAEAFLLCLIGVALVWTSASAQIPLGIGLGILVYALAVAFFMTISLWRNRRPSR